MSNILEIQSGKVTGNKYFNIFQASVSDQNSKKIPFSVGHHVACVWEDDKTFNHELSWFIGVVERVTEDGAYVSYMSQMVHDSMIKWKFPETARVHYTPLEQTIAWN